MQCLHCGHSPPADSLFCNMCGQRLPAKQEDSRGYTPPHLVEKVLRMRSALEGERKLVTVLFADVKGSVAISEAVDAESWHQIMDRFFAIVSSGIHDFEGTINQYTGDGIMALFGAPIAHEDHARRACLAALRIQRELRAWAEDLQQEYGVEFLVRIGMNSGEVVVGRIGDDLRMDYTAQGHTVGLAARMESLAKPGRIYISEFTRELIHHQFELRERADVKVKGVSSRVKVYELRKLEKYRSRFEVARERGLPPLIGRDNELNILETARRQALAGKGQLIALTGEPGIGKSRLLHEFAERCSAEDIKVVQTRGVPYYKAVPAAPLVSILKSYFAISEEDEVEDVRDKLQGLLKRLSPELQVYTDQFLDFLGVAQTEEHPPGFEKQLHGMAATIIRLIDAAVENDRGVVLVDNLHWIDNEVVSHLLDYLVEQLPHSHTLVVVTYRPEYQNRWLQHAHCQEVTLATLNEEEGAAYLNALLGDDESLVELKQQIIQRTGGNPLFMEQVARMLMDNGQLQKTRHGYQMTKALESVEVPAEIQALVSARVDRLPENDKRLLQVASVIGNQFAVELLQALSGLGAADVSSGLERLVAGGWIYRCSVLEGTAEVEYAFQQSLLRDVTYMGQLAENRATIHRAVADYLSEQKARRRDGYEALVAHHFAKAGDLEQAVDWHSRAATSAAMGDISIAVQHWRAVSELVAQMPASTKNADLALRAQSRLIYLGSRHGMPPAELEGLIEQGAKLAETVNDDSLRSFFYIAQATAYTFMADNRKAVAGFDLASQLESTKGVAGIQAVIAMGRAHLLMIMGELWQAESVIATALTQLDGDEESGAEFLGRSPYISLLCIKAWLRFYQGRLKESDRLLEAARELATQREEPEHLMLCDIVQALLLTETGYPRKAVDAAKQALDRAQRQQHRVLQVTALWVLGVAHVGAGNARRAIDVIEDALLLIRQNNVGLHVEQRIQVAFARALLQVGEGEKARGILREAIREARKRHQKVNQAEAELAMAELLLAEAHGRRTEAEVLGLLKQAESLIDEIGAEFLRPRWHLAALGLAEVKGDVERAKQERQSAMDVLQRLGATARLRKLRKRAKN